LETKNNNKKQRITLFKNVLINQFLEEKQGIVESKENKVVIPTGIKLLDTILGGGIAVTSLTIIFYLILQQFESYLITPLIIKKVTGVSSLVVILAVLIGAELAGIWGVILAVPFAVTLLEVFDDMEKKKTLARNS
jgi:predicted PurR-regulated permease PerM